MYLLVSLLFVVNSLTTAQVVQLGDCPDVETITDFNPTKYVGIWYENRKYPAIFELGGKCIIANYTALSQDTIGVENIQKNVLTGKTNSIKGKATLQGDPKRGKLVVTFTSVPFPAPYWVLDTDYDNYSVVWSCGQIFSINAQIVWILTRERHPSQEVINNALAVLEKKNIKTDPLRETNQEGCK